MKPLITSNTVTDEIERANIFKKMENGTCSLILADLK